MFLNDYWDGCIQDKVGDARRALQSEHLGACMCLGKTYKYSGNTVYDKR